MTLADEVGLEIYQMARLDVRRSPDGGAVEIARRLFGGGTIEVVRTQRVDACVADAVRRPRIALRAGLDDRRANFLIGQMIGRIFLARMGVVSQDDEHAIGARLVAPTEEFRVRLGSYGIDIGALADAFAITWTCASIRVAEVGGPDSVIATPKKIYRRGKLLRWVRDEDVRAIAAKPFVRSVHRVVLADEPGRVALFRKAS